MVSANLPVDIQDPLTRDEVISVVEGRSTARRVPIQIHFWIHPESFAERKSAVLEIMNRYPADLQICGLHVPDVFDAPDDDPEYRWVPFADPYRGKNVALDEQIAITDWAQLDEVLTHFPSADYPGLLRDVPAADGRYRLGHWWYCLFERHWTLRGMTNSLTDYYQYPDQVHRLYRALTDFYLGIMERGSKEQNFDGIFVSDDLGTQTQPFFSPEIFREFFKPYYRELFDKAHELGMHFWLHTCGDVEEFIPDWIEIGLDVLHPIQKHTMDERRVAERFGDQITIWAGLDVQQVIPWGTPEQVRAEVRYLLDTYWRHGEGRLILTAGNGINEDCTLESLEAFFSEAVSYGSKLVVGSDEEAAG